MINSKYSNILGYISLIVINLLILKYIFRLDTELTTPILYTGDFLPVIAEFKQIISGEFPMLGIPSSEMLSAPFVHTMNDYPTPFMSVWLLVRFFGIFTHDHFVITNLFIISSYLLNPVAMYFVLRRMRVGLAVALSIATIFNFLPFHNLRIMHTFYIGYFFIPLLVYILLLLLNKKPLFFKYSLSGNRYIFDFSRKNLIIIAILALSSTWNYYYTFFFLFFVGINLLMLILRKKGKYFIISSILVVVLSLLPFAVNMLPYIIYNANHGKNLEVANRHAGDAEVYGLKIAQLLLPIGNHRIDKLAEIKSEYDSRVPLVNENSLATLGAFASFGFLLLIVYAFVDHRKNSTLKRLSYYNLSAVLFGTIGGFSVLFALLITPDIRGYNRISIFIATFAFMATALSINDLMSRYKMKAAAQSILFVLILWLGIYDLAPEGMYLKTTDETRYYFASDKRFIKQIEAMVPQGSKIVQYPYMSYPEHPPIANMAAYSQIVGFLHSDTLKWSFGAITGREGDKWYQSLNMMPLEKQVAILKSSGFNGIYIDRNGYFDYPSAFEKGLEKLLQTKPLVSDDRAKSFFRLTPTANELYRFP